MDYSQFPRQAGGGNELYAVLGRLLALLRQSILVCSPTLEVGTDRSVVLRIIDVQSATTIRCEHHRKTRLQKLREDAGNDGHLQKKGTKQAVMLPTQHGEKTGYMQTQVIIGYAQRFMLRSTQFPYHPHNIAPFALIAKIVHFLDVVPIAKTERFDEV